MDRYGYGISAVPVIRSLLSKKLQLALQNLQSKQILPAECPQEVEILEPKQAGHGDYACNYAMTTAKAAGMNPRALAEAIAAELSADPDFSTIEVAGPGFLNLTLQPTFLAKQLQRGVETGLKPEPVANPRRINVEFVSVNPNGPVTIGSGRGAAFGSVLCNVLEAVGNTVHREFYVNDGVNSEQMRLFAASVRHYVMEQIGRDSTFPENGYRGDYVERVATRLVARHGADASAAAVDRADSLNWFQSESQAEMIKHQQEDLEAFGVVFDTWFSEQSLHDAGKVAEMVDDLVKRGAADDRPQRNIIKLAKKGVWEAVEHTNEAPVAEEDAEGAGEHPTLWLRSTKFGDDMDRVLRRRDGRLTYIASDLAYHNDKFNRPTNGNKLITILGPDHHGYIGRLQAVIAALVVEPGTGSPAERNELESQIWGSDEEMAACRAAAEKAKDLLEVVIFQLVRFVKDGQPAPMRKRDGNIYAVVDLIDEIGRAALPDADQDAQRRIGRDVARYFYLMRSHDTPMDFDLDLAARQSDDNPVFYVQYAHARICAVLSKAEVEGFDPNHQPENLDLLTHERELALMKKVLDLPHEISRCAELAQVHRLASYATELARAFHHFYDVCRVVQADEPDLTRQRIYLCSSVRLALRECFNLLGISAPERM